MSSDLIRFAIRARPGAKRKRALDSATSGTDELRIYFTGADGDLGASEPTGTDYRTHTKQMRMEALEDTHSKARRLQTEGNTLAEAGRFRAAIERWQEALTLDPTSAVLCELLAQAYMQIFEDFQAVQFARRATELDSEWGDGFHTLARCHLNFGELKLAKSDIERAIELNGKTDELLDDLTEITHLLGEQRVILQRRDEEAAREVDADKLQVISCMKHLSLRGKAGE